MTAGGGRLEELGAAALERLLDPSHDDGSSLAPGLDVLKRRSDRLAVLAGDLASADREGRLTRPLGKIVPAFAHMFANRMLRSDHRSQELLLYDFLARLYESRAIRAQKTVDAPQSSGKVSV